MQLINQFMYFFKNNYIFQKNSETIGINDKIFQILKKLNV